MDASKSNKLAMYRAVIALLETSAALLAGITKLPAKLAAFKALVAGITKLAATQAQPTVGAVGTRDEQLALLADEALAIAGGVQSYADENKLHELAAKVRLTPTHFRSGRKEDRVRLAQQVHDATSSVVTELGDYGVTDRKLANLQALITLTLEALSRPRSTAAEKKAATARLPAAFKEADALLENQIDPLLRPLERAQPEFYARYKAARIIIDRRGGHDNGDSTPPIPTPAASTPPASS